ncbi:hypothetical protein ACVII1_007258 [Bradyrhizobium elkanii]|nr:hypothetical protein [Bradyrhizobium elkanii]MCS3588101.1 hypothetical protein [Bradyrhizobium elkanii]MCS3617545.1 hypothetical protein [Bradyrhizobium elkanii]MCS3686567.1 hypothetical protein [Bradyrhizobium elkanii]
MTITAEFVLVVVQDLKQTSILTVSAALGGVPGL